MDRLNIDEFYVKTKHEFGKVQKLWIVVLSLFQFYAGLHISEIVYIARIPKFTCTIHNETYQDTCGGQGLRMDCDKFNYSTNSADSLIMRWETSCPFHSTVPRVLQICYSFGCLFGALVIGRIADKIGAKKVLAASTIAFTVAGPGSFIPVMGIYAALRVVSGICTIGCLNCSFVLASELVGPRLRGRVGIFQRVFVGGFSILASAGISYLFQNDWRLISMVFGLIGLPLLPTLFFIPESPHWLATRGKYKGVVKTLTKVAGALTLANYLDQQQEALEKEKLQSNILIENQIVAPASPSRNSLVVLLTENQAVDQVQEGATTIGQIQQMDDAEAETTSGLELRQKSTVEIISPLKEIKNQDKATFNPFQLARQVTMCQMFRYKFLRLSIQFLSWFTTALVYYTILLTSGNMGTNFYVGTTLGGIVEFPFLLLVLLLVDRERVGRRSILVCAMVTAGICTIVQAELNNNLYISLIGRGSSTAAFGILYLHTTELFPTSVRSGGLGICSSIGRIGVIISSVFVATPAKDLTWAFVGIGILTIISGLANMMLPETANKKLPETMDDLNKNLGPCKILY